MTVAYAIDALRVRERRCFGWGFLLDPDSPAVSWELHVELASGATAVVHGLPGGSRPDVASAFPAIPHAGGSGFILQGTVPGDPAPGRDARLAVRLRDGRLVERLVPAAIIDAACERDAGSGGLLDRLRAHRARHGLRATVRAVLARVAGRVALEWATRSQGASVVIDHEMGGGANTFRHDLVGRLAARGPCLVLTPVVDLVAYRMVVHVAGRSFERVETAIEPVLARLSSLRAPRLHVNEVVSFPDPLRLLDWCAQMKRTRDASLTFYLHDYHAVCPSWTLMGREDRFCGVPVPSACAACLPSNRLHTLGFAPPGLRIEDWRSAWGAFLGHCDRIRAFSRASVEILARAYPEVAEAGRVEVEGHVVAGGLRPVRLQPRRPGDAVVVACAGHISVAKGSDMVLAMARNATERGRGLRFVVLGSLDGYAGEDGIEVLGRYDRASMPALLEQHGVTLGMLPSVCAETFSFVTAEFVQMQLPVAVFPIGAPAERIATYDKGLVLSRIDPAVAVDEILAFAERLAGERLPHGTHN